MYSLIIKDCFCSQHSCAKKKLELKNFLPSAQYFKGQPRCSEPLAAVGLWSRLSHFLANLPPSFSVLHLLPSEKQISQLG